MSDFSFYSIEVSNRLKEYEKLEAQRCELEAAHSTPTGGEDYDLLYLRNDLDYRRIMQRQSEIRDEIGHLFIEQATGIKR